MRVVGTAGHVDHGKSTLVQALTGIDPDRLQEEKARGMTIDLGFAWVDLSPPSGVGTEQSIPIGSASIGIVDVPGHIDFIKNMLAGVGGIDAAILVIAADEGVMPQTREHLAILDLLAVPAAVVALTKADLIDDPEWLDLVELDVAELLEQTHLAGSPIVRVSALTGEGLNDLRRELATVLESLAPRRNRARPRLPIDRVFSLSGFGTIVTGTLSDGELETGSAVEVLPAGHPARIRGLQTHRRKIERALPGSRVAVNLTGVGTDDVRRGQVVVLPKTLQPTALIDVSFRLLPDAPKPLKHNQSLDLFIGAAETPARVRLLGRETLQPGETGWLQLRLEQPIVAAAGDRFILRQPSPSATLGGGTVVNAQPRRRWRRFDPVVLTRLETLSRGAPDEILLEVIGRQVYLSPSEAKAQSGLDLADAEAALDELLSQQALVRFEDGGEPALLTLARWNRTRELLQEQLTQFHAQNPLRRGMARSELRNRLQSALGARSLSVRLFNAWIDAAAAEGAVQGDDGAVWLADFAVILQPAQERRVAATLAALDASPFSPPGEAEVLRLLNGETTLLEMLVGQGKVVRLGGGVLFTQSAFDEMVERIREFAAQQGAITLAEARDLFDTSRKYAQAVLEEMDARRITRREGDARVLRSG